MIDQRTQDFVPVVILAGFVLLAVMVLLIPSNDVLPVLVYLPLVGLLAGILYVRGIRPIDPDFPASLFSLAVVVKLIGSLIYFWFVIGFYGKGDANAYHREAQYVAELFKQLDFSILGHTVRGSQQSTNLIYFVGLLYTVLPPSLPGSGFLFSGLALTGSVLFYRAYRVALPDTQPQLFRLGIFFFPSILFWTAALSKDAWVFATSGLVAYGLARYWHQNRTSGLISVALGLLLTTVIRPHVTALMAVAIVGAYLFSFFGSETQDRHKRLGTKLVGLALSVTLILFAIQIGAEFFGLERFTQAEVQEYYEGLQGYYVESDEGSSFQASSVFEPIGAIQGVITVLSRPFPWEAYNVQAFLASLESILWLLFLWFRRRVFWSRVRRFAGNPWSAFLLLYSLVMILALTSLANFGLLARQRVMFLPFLLMLFA